MAQELPWHQATGQEYLGSGEKGDEKESPAANPSSHSKSKGEGKGAKGKEQEVACGGKRKPLLVSLP